MRATSILFALCVAGCFPEVDTGGLEPIDDYRDWYQIETSGAISGHGDSIRAIYVNDTALERQTPEYPSGSVLIKEVYDNDGGQRGSLEYFALMRKLTEGEEPDGAKLRGSRFSVGWMFTMIDGSDINGTEVYFDRCWTSCHVAAPFDGTFIDYQ